MEPPLIRACSEGALLAVHAQPGARRSGIVGLHGGRLKIAVTTAAEKGKANQEILRVLAKALGLKVSQFAVQSGQTNPRKSILVADISSDDLQVRVERLLR